MKRLGERIKRKREMMHLQLNDLAKRVGVSSSALSQIEKAKATPSIVTLKAIADNLHTTVGELIGENENLSQNPHIVGSEIQFIEKNASGSELYLLSHHDVQKHMETYLIRFAKQSTIEGFFSAHHGQQAFCHVKSGSFDFILDETHYELNEGDNFYFDTVLSHRIQLKEGDLGEIVWVTTN
jgi:XRE family transcriptional regulator, regulator of sulfur utilization